MAGADSTRWTVIREAAAGGRSARQAFARRYAPAVRAYLGARWRGGPLLQEVDDAVQEVFVDLFRDGGALERVEERPGGFRAFLYGVVRNIARHVETHRARSKERQAGSRFDPAAIPDDEESLAAAFDRAWTLALLREAVARHREAARDRGPAAVRRVELLRLRFREGLPIREIATLWGLPTKRLHKDYARARDEFRDVLLDVVAEHHGGSRDDVDDECARLLDLVQ